MCRRSIRRWRSSGGLIARIVAATAVGSLAGLGVFSLTQVTSRILFVVTGGVVGAVTVLAVQWYRRLAQLTEVKVSIPQLSELTFAVNNDSRQVAWRMFVETVTRVSTQPLVGDEGVVREALTSMYGLFGTARETLKAARPSAPVPGGQTVEYLAITMLNRELRPFLSQWHPRLREFERAHPDSPESAWPDNAACRAELQRVQHAIHDYAIGSARLAGVREPEPLVRYVPAPRPSDGRTAGGTMPAAGSGPGAR
ncbi:hypothetical protein [Streptomyces luteolus]|uniref:Uncharacterized protein n=1 Tax=Streptomyces luteolus TaxID=3043615 RepID=A0ABT6T7F3_9ACTN|nr:hypothetical protein [Streptomyces sp. B-S-A12]MDI3423605.1 hypothetical protein [Streptomyces sp. B-S-A12]